MLYVLYIYIWRQVYTMYIYLNKALDAKSILNIFIIYIYINLWLIHTIYIYISYVLYIHSKTTVDHIYGLEERIPCVFYSCLFAVYISYIYTLYICCMPYIYIYIKTQLYTLYIDLDKVLDAKSFRDYTLYIHIICIIYTWHIHYIYILYVSHIHLKTTVDYIYVLEQSTRRVLCNCSCAV